MSSHKNDLIVMTYHVHFVCFLVYFLLPKDDAVLREIGIYWCKIKKDDGLKGFEVLDGQQRTISLCEYVDGSFAVDDKYVYNLPSDVKKKILAYQPFVYVCDGTDSERLDWFRVINIAGEQLSDQELRNAVYAGS